MTIRIGSGAGYSGDRIEPAVELAERGELGYLVFECLAERTIALAQQERLRDPRAGYDPLLEERMRGGPARLPRQRRHASSPTWARPIRSRPPASIAEVARRSAAAGWRSPR